MEPTNITSPIEIEILNADHLRAWCQRIQMPEGAITTLLEMAAAVRTDPSLGQIFQDFYKKTVIRGEWHREWSPLPMDPVVKALGDEKASQFYLLGYLSALPHAEQTYRRLGIPLDIFDVTMSDIAFHTTKPYQIHGQWKFKEFSWIYHHLSCELFRLGRLQYILTPFEYGVTALRNSSSKVQLLCSPDVALRPDGSAQGSGKPEAERESGRPEKWKNDPTTWFAAFEENETGWLGHPVNAIGNASRETGFYPRSEWECVLRKGDDVLDLHIPRGQNLSIEDCRDSLREAFEFFPRYWPNRPFKAVICHTWLFTPQLQQILPSESNIVRFQREFYLHPYPGGPEFLWTFVFGEKYPDRASAPRDSGLRRAVLDWLEQGHELFDLPGIMLHGPDQWGSQPYWRED